MIAIVSEGLPNEHLCLGLAEDHELIAVFHPIAPPKSWRRSLNSFRRWRRTRGTVYVALHKLGRGGSMLGWPLAKRLEDAKRAFFSDAHGAYRREIAPRARCVEDVNSPAFAEEIRGLAADAVICSGGPGYREPLLRAARLILNYHTGISPIYNGAHTNIWAYLNAHPQFCGGTLMLMNETVDGGDILAHHFCGVDPEDDPASVFCKAIKAAPQLCGEFLSDFEKGKSFNSVPQSKPMFYYRSLDWTVYQSLLAKQRYIENLRSKRHTESETILYWRCVSPEAAKHRLESEMLKRLHVKN